MILNVVLKMILRSWWRNKVFFLVSVASLALGLSCTSMGWKDVIRTVTACFFCGRMTR